MRRKDREITDRSEIDQILKEAEVLHLALNDNGTPYALCVNFGYDGEALYIHGANAGRKIDILNENPIVCFQAYTDYAMVVKKKASHFTARYRSVVGMGKAEFITTSEDKRYGLDVLMKGCAPGEEYSFGDEVVGRTAVIKIAIESITGKQNGF
ncbi:MAG: pyridoxamine 5'-phosphate oxidase family protein [Eubacteriales bacterium]